MKYDSEEQKVCQRELHFYYEKMVASDIFNVNGFVPLLEKIFNFKCFVSDHLIIMILRVKFTPHVFLLSTKN